MPQNNINEGVYINDVSLRGTCPDKCPLHDVTSLESHCVVVNTCKSNIFNKLEATEQGEERYHGQDWSSMKEVKGQNISEYTNNLHKRSFVTPILVEKFIQTAVANAEGNVFEGTGMDPNKTADLAFCCRHPEPEKKQNPSVDEVLEQLWKLLPDKEKISSAIKEALKK